MKSLSSSRFVRPYGDIEKEAENWTGNLLHRHEGNASLIVDAIELSKLPGYAQKSLFVNGYDPETAKMSLDPLLNSLEVLMSEIVRVRIGERKLFFPDLSRTL